MNIEGDRHEKLENKMLTAIFLISTLGYWALACNKNHKTYIRKYS